MNELTRTTLLPSGENVILRPLRAEDAARLGDYFARLSTVTRSLYAPHPFDQATADSICASLDPADTLQMVAVLSEDGRERIIAYFLLGMAAPDSDRQRYARYGLSLDSTTDAALAPSVADGYQSQGVGSVMMQHLLDIARRLGKRRMLLLGGVYLVNERAIHFYEKWGFRMVGEFGSDRRSYDMILDLA